MIDDIDSVQATFDDRYQDAATLVDDEFDWSDGTFEGWCVNNGYATDDNWAFHMWSEGPEEVLVTDPDWEAMVADAVEDDMDDLAEWMSA